MPVFQPYGGWGWYISCIFPPSAVSLFAYVLLKVEAGGQGLQWDNLSLSVTSQSSYPFNARVVFLAIIFDIVFYALLAAYLDKVSLQTCTSLHDLLEINLQVNTINFSSHTTPDESVLLIGFPTWTGSFLTTMQTSLVQVIAVSVISVQRVSNM